MGESRSHLPVIALVLALMLSSGLLGLHLADRVTDHTPDPYPPVILLPR